MNVTRNKPANRVVARIMRQGEKYHESFGVKEHGSWRKAEEAAKTWVVAKRKKLPPPMAGATGIMSSRNRSGVVGVSLAKRVTKRGGGKVYEYMRWIAKWPGCPLAGGVVWTINDLLNDEDAFVCAVLSRREESVDRDFVFGKLMEIYDTDAYYDILDLKRQ